jgi:hypothetical protein
VTRSEGNRIYEIDGKPALEVLQEYLPDTALADNWGRYILTFGLCFRAPSYFKGEEYIFRAMFSMDTTDGSVTIPTEVQEGASVWFSSRDKKKIATGLDRMAERIKQELGGEKPKLVFQFDCAARGKTMFREQEKLQLLRQFRQAVGPEVPWAGFYTAGEIGPAGESTTATTTIQRSFSPSVDNRRMEGDRQGDASVGESKRPGREYGPGLLFVSRTSENPPSTHSGA